MKRLIRWIINWLYAEEIAALVQEAVDDEFEATWPEAFRHQPEHNSVIPQEIWAAVILHLPNHAEIIHGQWMDNTNHAHVLTRTVKLANTTHIREFQLTMDAYRLRLDHAHSRDEIFCGRYAHLLQVQIWLPGNFNYKTGECREIGTETTLEINVTTGKPVTRRAVKVQYNPDCVYLQALNNRNAMRKLVKAGYIKMVKQDGKGPHVED